MITKKEQALLVEIANTIALVAEGPTPLSTIAYTSARLINGLVARDGEDPAVYDEVLEVLNEAFDAKLRSIHG